jgi:hypothetical protein
VGKIVGVVGPHVLADAELSAQEGGADFGDQFFGDIGIVGKALAEIAIEARFGAGPVDMLVTKRCVVALAPRHGGSAGEQRLVRHLDEIAGAIVVGAIAAMPDIGCCRSKETLGSGKTLDRRKGIGFGGGLETTIQANATERKRIVISS